MSDVVDLLLQKNIVALFQGKSEAGQRSLGNRSLLFDPRVSNGKDIVNQIKKEKTFVHLQELFFKKKHHKWFNMLSLQRKSLYAICNGCL
jgi:carbamoyltransferase